MGAIGMGRLRRVGLVGAFLCLVGSAGSGDRPERAKRLEKSTHAPAMLPSGLERALRIAPNAQHDIQIRLARPTAWVTWPRWWSEAKAQGRIADEGSLHQSRREWIAVQKTRAKAVLDPVAAKVEAHGGLVRARYPMLLGLRIAVTREMFMALLRAVRIVQVDGASVLAADGGQDPRIEGVSAQAVREGHQLTLLDEDGEEAGSGLHVAMWEHDGWPYPDPEAWRRRYGGTLSVRLHGCRRRDCSDARHSPHASATLAVLATDFLEGRSSSRKLTVHAHVIRPASLPAVIDATLASEDDIRVVNMSASLDGRRDWSCRGVDLSSRDVDALFENGIIVVKSAGNDGESDTTCTVGPPGAATSVLTVGALDAKKDNAQGVRTAGVLSTSGVGGLSSGGRSVTEVTPRTVIDLAAQGCRQGTIPGDGRTFVGCGTSFATPTVTAAALLRIEAGTRVGLDEDLHHRPGALMASLLSMGDGFRPNPEAPARSDDRVVGFDRRVGAGRLRVREVEALIETCLVSGEAQYFPGEDGLVVPEDMDGLQAVLFWYDAGIEGSGKVNNLDLAIEQMEGGEAPDHPVQWRAAAASTHPHDNKERVILRGVGGQRLRIAVRGTQVRARVPTADCQRAHLVYTFEQRRRGVEAALR